MAVRGGGGRERVVKWSGKNEFLSGKSQGISFQTKSGHPEYECRLHLGSAWCGFIAILMKILCSADPTAVQDQTTWASKIVIPQSQTADKSVAS